MTNFTKKYFELSSSWASIQFGSVLFGVGLNTAVMMTLVGALYFIPAVLGIAAGMYGLALLVQFLTYKMLKVNPSKENRWMMNSIIAFIYNTPWAILAGGCFAFLFSVIITVPIVVISAFYGVPEATEGSNYYILVLEHYSYAIDAMTSGNGWAAIFHTFIYSKNFAIDAIRITCQFVCMIGFCHPAKNRFSKEEFMLDENDYALRYERGFDE